MTSSLRWTDETGTRLTECALGRATSPGRWVARPGGGRMVGAGTGDIRWRMLSVLARWMSLGAGRCVTNGTPARAASNRWILGMRWVGDGVCTACIGVMVCVGRDGSLRFNSAHRCLCIGSCLFPATCCRQIPYVQAKCSRVTFVKGARKPVKPYYCLFENTGLQQLHTQQYSLEMLPWPYIRRRSST